MVKNANILIQNHLLAKSGIPRQALFTFSVTNESLFSSVCSVRSVVINYPKPLIQSDFLNIITTERPEHTEKVEKALLTEKLTCKGEQGPPRRI